MFGSTATLLGSLPIETWDDNQPIVCLQGREMRLVAAQGYCTSSRLHRYDPDNESIFATFFTMPMPSSNPKLGSFHYLDKTVKHSLYRNGEVLTRRDPDGSDAGTEGMHLHEHEMVVQDARCLRDHGSRTLENNGFELHTQALPARSIDFFSHDDVARSYYPHCAQIVKEATGSAQVFAFDHNIRSAAGKESRKRIAGGQEVQGPAHVVHGDYTLTSAPQRLHQLTSPPSGNDTLRHLLSAEQSVVEPSLAEHALGESGRFAIINVWRNIAEEAVATHPLALCDAQSVHPLDLVVFEIHYQDRVGENYFSKHAARHQWYYYPALTQDEALLIKQWDSAGQLARSQGEQADASNENAPCTFSFHSAFDAPSTPPSAAQRWSIEVRCMALYD